MNEIRVIKGKKKDVLVNYINTCSIFFLYKNSSRSVGPIVKCCLLICIFILYKI